MAPNTIITRPAAAAVGSNGDRQVMPLTETAEAADTTVVPAQVVALERQLQVNQQRYMELDDYYRGQHAHSFDSLRFQQAFGRQLGRFADNWMRVVVRTTANRLTIQGIRVGSTDVSGDSSLDMEAWRIWQASRLDRQSRMVHRDAMKFGTGFLLVDPTPTVPRITVESPYQVVGQRDDEEPHKLVNAIKKWIGNDNRLHLNFYTADVVMKFTAPLADASSVPNDKSRLAQTPAWRQDDEVTNPLGAVPVVPIENEPDPIFGGESDLDDLIPLNDWLNKIVRDALVASEYQGFRQRWVTGVDIPKDLDTGKPLTDTAAQLRASNSNVWMFGDKDAKAGEFGQVDLSGYVAMMQEAIHHISMISLTPAYLLVGKMANLSADAILAAELGFVGKLQGKQSDYGVGWNYAHALALSSRGVIDVEEPVEVIWKDAAAHSGSVLANELAIMAKLGVPQEALLEKYGYSPMVIGRWKAAGMLQPMDSNAAAQISPGPMDKGNSTIP